MPVITCPQCGVNADLPQLNRTADEFCVKCDYPLFWAPAATATEQTTESTDANLRRLPGTGGRRTIGSRSCPTCGENNPLTGTECIRCGNPLDPVPVEIRSDYMPTPAPYEAVEKRDGALLAWLLAIAAVSLIVLLVLALVL
ncbi:MAG: zinc finger Ran-binding domain-containing protein [Acidimicrobiia bacterium]|nr:zinc finger Ran-binding domain-containing protein [Acidimicrobiia bacterium]